MMTTNSTFTASRHKIGYVINNIMYVSIFYEFKVKWDYFLDFDFLLGGSFCSSSFSICAALVSTASIIS